MLQFLRNGHRHIVVDFLRHGICKVTDILHNTVVVFQAVSRSSTTSRIAHTSRLKSANMSYGRYKGPYNEKNPIPDGEARISIYNYTPAFALGLIGAILFGLAAIGHFYFWWIGGKKRVARDGRGRPTRWFEALWTLGCVMEVVGYGFRTYSHKNPFYVNGQ
jgi:hypothetical protein